MSLPSSDGSGLRGRRRWSDRSDGATRTVGLLTYIFDNDRAGEAFLQALVRAHARGVQVRVLIDDVGARYSRPTMLRLLAREGIRAAAFLPVRHLVGVARL